MNIHEYQGKALFKAHGVKVLEGVHCTTVEDAVQAYDTLQSKVVFSNMGVARHASILEC